MRCFERLLLSEEHGQVVVVERAAAAATEALRRVRNARKCRSIFVSSISYILNESNDAYPCFSASCVTIIGYIHIVEGIRLSRMCCLIFRVRVDES